MKTAGIAILISTLLSAACPLAETSRPLYTVPDPLSASNRSFKQQNVAMPQMGRSINEPCFGLSLRRITTSDGDGARHEYSRFDPYNKDQTRIILNANGGQAQVYSTRSYPYNDDDNFIMRLPVTEPRWDRHDPDLIWGLERFSIHTVNVSSGKITMVKDFASDPVLRPYLGKAISRITMKDEGEASYDNRYWAFMIQGDGALKYRPQHVFSWDRQTDQVLGVYTLKGNEQKIDWVGMSPKGRYVLIGGLNYKGDETVENITGLTMASQDLTRFNRLDYTTAHADVGLDSRGNEVVVIQNTRTDYIDLIPIDWKTKAIKSAAEGYEGTNRTKLLRLFYNDSSPEGFQGGVHISGNHDGYALISTTIGSSSVEQNWLDKSLVLIKLDPNKPVTQHLSKTYNTTKTYWEETHGSITNDGKKVLWAANWDQHVGDNRCFLLELDLAGTGIPGQ